MKTYHQMFTHEALLHALHVLSQRDDKRSRASRETIQRIIDQQVHECDVNPNAETLTEMIDTIVFG